MGRNRIKKESTEFTRSFVEKLYVNHDIWVTIVRRLDNAYKYPEDVVMTFYEQMLLWATPKMLKEDGELNMPYLYISLRNAWILTKKTESRVQYCELKPEYEDRLTEATDEEREAFEKICQIIEKEAKEWEWYDRELFNIYFTSDMSYRTMSKEIGISFVSLYNNIRESSKKIKKILKEDYEDFLGGDYDYIN